MLLKVHPDNPSVHKISQVASILNKDGIIVFPTDTVYALGCDMRSKKGFDRICKLRHIQPEKALFSIIVQDLSQAAEYISQIPNSIFRVVKNHTPGAFTFIFNSGKNLPSHLKKGRKTIGVRIPDHRVCESIVKSIDGPLVTASFRSDDEILEYYNDPDEIFSLFGKQVDCVIDSGPGSFHPSTIVDCTGSEPVLVREGKGSIDL